MVPAMKTTLDEKQAYRYDRFTCDVNAVYKRLQKEIPDLKKTKLKKEKLFAEVYVFWYLRDGFQHYLLN
jgi:hypothetical protein